MNVMKCTLSYLNNWLCVCPTDLLHLLLDVGAHNGVAGAGLKMADDQVWAADETEHWMSRTVTVSYEIRAKVQKATLNNQSQNCLLIRVYHSQWEWECLMLRNSTKIVVKKHVIMNSITLKQCTHKVFSQFHRMQNKAQLLYARWSGGGRPVPGRWAVGACAEATKLFDTVPFLPNSLPLPN